MFKLIHKTVTFSLTFTLNLDRNNYSIFQKLIDKVVFSDLKLSDEEKELSQIKLNEITKGRAFENFLGNTEPNMTLGYGQALLGYFFLRLHDPIMFPKLTANIIDFVEEISIEN